MWRAPSIPVHGSAPLRLDAETTVVRDEHGIPKLEAACFSSLAFGQGRCHATDRLVQCVMLRTVARGQLTEILADNDDTVKIDTFFRGMRIGEDADAEAELMRLAAERDDPGARRLWEFLTSYCAGFNTVLDGFRRPAELIALGVRPSPWTPSDVIVTVKAMSYIGLAQCQEDAQRCAIESVRGGVDPDIVRALFDAHWRAGSGEGNGNGGGGKGKTPNGSREGGKDTVADGCTPGDAAFPGWPEMAQALAHFEGLLPEGVRFQGFAPSVMASNNWVVSGARTASGFPLCAHDPHLEVNRLPAIWYEMTGGYGGGRHFSGVTMPGVPGMVMGRTRDICISFTYGFADQIDFFFEEVRGGLVRTGPGDGDFASPVHTETVLRRKSAGEETIHLFETPEGRRMIEVPESVTRGCDGNTENTIPDGLYISKSWVGRDPRASRDTLSAVLEILHAENVKEACAHASRVAISCNWLVAEARRGGSIALQQSGVSPVRPRGASGFFPMPGWMASLCDPQCPKVDPSSLVSCVDPECGFLATANDDITEQIRGAQGGEDSWARIVNLRMGNYRARRIREQLEAMGSEIGTAEVCDLQRDLESPQAREMLSETHVIGSLLREIVADGSPAASEAARRLLLWDCTYTTDSTGAPVFESVYSAVLAAVFGPHFGRDAWEHIAGETPVLIDYYDIFDAVLRGIGGANDTTGGNGCCFGIQWVTDRGALRSAVESSLASVPVGTRWGTLRSVAMKNVLFDGKLPSFLQVDHGPIEIPGGRATIVQGALFRSHGRVSTFCPSYRCVTDLSEPVMLTTLAGGVSGSPFSPLYRSDIDNWIEMTHKTVRMALPKE